MGYRVPSVFHKTFVVSSVLSMAVKAPLVLATPVNRSDVSPVYVPDPSGRGTVALVSSCLLTLTLCVWTAIHLNVFPPGTSWFKRTLYKAARAVLGIVAPEIVLWRATVQWLIARKVRSAINARLSNLNSEERATPVTHPTSNDDGSNQDDAVETPSSETQGKSHAKKKWTLAHGFFVVMGGI